MKIQHKLQAGLLLVLIVIVLLIVRGYYNYKQMLETSQWVARSERLLFENEDFISSVLDMEIGARGYAITRDEAYLKSYEAAKISKDTLIAHLIVLAIDNPVQKQRIQHFNDLVAKRILFQDSIIMLTQIQGTEAGLALIATKRGKVLGDSIRVNFVLMQKEEKEILAWRQKENESQIDNFSSILIISLLILITIIVLLAYFVNKNIRERIKNEKSLVRSLKETSDYKYALDKSSIVTITDQKALIKYVNDNFCEISKYNREELIGQDNRILNSGYHSKEFIRDLWTTIVSGKVWTGEIKNKAKSGFFYWVNTTIVPFQDEAGKPFQYLAIASDITERKKAEEQLKEYKHFFLNSNDFSCIANLEGYFEALNPKFEKILGYSEKELLENGFVNFIHTDDIAATLEEVEKLKKGALTINFVNRYRKKDGSYLWFDWNATPDPVTGKLYSIARDITERKKAEDQLKAVNQELESFSYSVSHDLRAPLRAINGYAKILEEDYAEKFDADGMSYFKAIQQNSKKMGQLIDALLAFSRLGKKELIVSEINMTTLVKSVSEEEMANESNEINFTIHELLPARGEQVLIKQVWINLISNAIKYSKHKPKISIEIGSSLKGNLVVYYVKDNGAGFDMQYYDKLFGVFQRLHSQEEFEGTGIGLAIVQKLILRHGGTVWAESKINEGACFYFSLPTITTVK